MHKSVVAVVAIAGTLVACAPASKSPATPGAAPTSQQQSPAGQSPHTNAGPAAGVSLSGVKKADKTVAEVYAGKESLAGTEVTVRGKVVKFSSRIMGRNWAHVQDGSGAAGTNDLTVTTQDTARVGDTVLVSGKVSLNKDFGGGYRYTLIVEDGSVTVEP
jgi:hypothetical protein